MQHQDSLPSLGEVATSDKMDSSHLLIYREAHIHPYRSISVLVNEEDCLLNTIYDDERVVSNDPRLPARPDVTPPRQPLDEFEERLRQSMERVIAFELRVQRLSTVVVEFVAGITRATRE